MNPMHLLWIIPVWTIVGTAIVMRFERARRRNPTPKRPPYASFDPPTEYRNVSGELSSPPPGCHRRVNEDEYRS